MTNSLIVRDFFKAYRELRYANSGSIRLTEIEHNAYLNRLTVEITHYDAPRAINTKTLPENTHWGYLTAFKGSSVTSNNAVKFVRQRMFECINQGIWEYHQNTENVALSKAFAEQAATAVLSGGILEGGQEKIVDFYLKLISNLPEQIDQDLQWILSFFYRPDEPTELGNQEYTAFPIASPFPDVFKFKSDIPCSFLFRLESWYLVNPAVYIVANPTDSSDETEDEDEYPEPQQGDGDGDSQEFPESSPGDPLSDPRDGGAKPEPEVEPTVGYVWIGVVSGTLLSGQGQPESFTQPVEFNSLGSGFPFTVETRSETILVYQGESWKAGFKILDRFGQTVGEFFQNVGYRQGSLTVVASVKNPL